MPSPPSRAPGKVGKEGGFSGSGSLPRLQPVDAQIAREMEALIAQRTPLSFPTLLLLCIEASLSTSPFSFSPGESPHHPAGSLPRARCHRACTTHAPYSGDSPHPRSSQPAPPFSSSPGEQHRRALRHLSARSAPSQPAPASRRDSPAPEPPSAPVNPARSRAFFPGEPLRRRSSRQPAPPPLGQLTGDSTTTVPATARELCPFRPRTLPSSGDATSPPSATSLERTITHLQHSSFSLSLFSRRGNATSSACCQPQQTTTAEAPMSSGPVLPFPAVISGTRQGTKTNQCACLSARELGTRQGKDKAVVEEIELI